MPRAGHSDGAASAFPFDADAGKVFLRSMNTVTSRPVSSRQLAVPNLLTYARIAAVPAVVACLYWQDILQGGEWLRWLALTLFIAAGITDMLAAYGTIRGWSLWAAIVILCREILVSGLREYLAELRVSVPVTRLAKWKTTVQLVAIGFLLAGKAGDEVVSFVTGNELTPVVTYFGLTLLWISAIVTLYTGYDYFRAGVRHLIEE